MQANAEIGLYLDLDLIKIFLVFARQINRLWINLIVLFHPPRVEMQAVIARGQLFIGRLIGLGRLDHLVKVTFSAFRRALNDQHTV